MPLKTTKCNEQRDEETGIGYCDTYQPHAPRRIKDTENPSPHNNPHVHIEKKVNGRWKTERIWPTDVDPN